MPAPGFEMAAQLPNADGSHCAGLADRGELGVHVLLLLFALSI
jgi:hypothetical protein